MTSQLNRVALREKFASLKTLDLYIQVNTEEEDNFKSNLLCGQSKPSNPYSNRSLRDVGFSHCQQVADWHISGQSAD